MTPSAAKGFGRAAARKTKRDDCTTELAAFRALYGYEHSEAFVKGFWAERIAIECPAFVNVYSALL